MIKLFFRSLYLDYKFLALSLPTFGKLSFIFKKYFTLIKNFAIGFTPGRSFTKIFGKKFYYDDKFGIAFLQSVYVDHALLKKYIKPQAIVIDIGANIGQFNFFCKHFLKAKTVCSFEPVKKTFQILQKNAQEHCYNYAISTKKSLTLYVPELSLMAGNFKTQIKSKKEQVETLALDKFKPLESEKKIDLIKIDTEGSEYDVILASKEIIKKSKYLLVEASISRKSYGNLEDIIKILETISPQARLIEKGRKYKDNGEVIAMDVLIKIS